MNGKNGFQIMKGKIMMEYNLLRYYWKIIKEIPRKIRKEISGAVGTTSQNVSP